MLGTCGVVGDFGGYKWHYHPIYCGVGCSGGYLCGKYSRLASECWYGGVCGCGICATWLLDSLYSQARL